MCIKTEMKQYHEQSGNISLIISIAMIFFVVLVACTTTYAENLPSKPYYDLDNAPNLFKEFILEYNKVYNPDEYLKRQEIFKENLKHINELNQRSSARYRVNVFADLTAEGRERFLGYDDLVDEEAVELSIPEEQVKDLPDTFDWRDYNVVTRVKDQGTCGSSWIFSAIGAIESQYAIKHNKTIELSEQQALDCINPCDGKSNCHTGLPHTVMLHAMNGVMSEKDYNYTGTPSVCSEGTLKSAATVDSVTIYKPTEESLKKLLIVNGPLSVALQGQGLLWYRNGIVDEFCQCYGPVNHNALLVGYGDDDGIPYWILKNSWGEKWGEHGYFRLERGNNACFMGTTYTAGCTVA